MKQTTSLKPVVSTGSSTESDSEDASLRNVNTSNGSKGAQQINNDSKPTSKHPSDTSAPVVWGRNIHSTLGVSLFSIGMMTFAPCFVIFFWIVLEHFEGSLFHAGWSFATNDKLAWLALYSPQFNRQDFVAYAAWFFFQAGLYTYLPGPLSTGQLTPAGYQLQYYTNGFSAWVFTHVLFISLCIFGVLDPAFIARHWPGLLVAANIMGFLLSFFAFFKAHFFPTHKPDLKFSGSWAYDFYMGIEFNPRFGSTWDLKLFTNGRPGIVAWILVDLSFVAWQYQIHGYVSNSIVIVTILHAIYVIDFFINEDWYLRTIDIAHDHFGYYLAWASLTWLPSMYTLQTQYLARHPVDLPWPVDAAILGVGVGAYIMFRSVNSQKDVVRKTDGECLIWGKKPEVMVVDYVTQDGKKHKSLLLCSGWWGFSRHANYLADLILSFSMCATCGVKNLLPWFYIIFMLILLLHRCHRDEQRCAAKYGRQWDKYVARVPWKLLPGVY